MFDKISIKAPIRAEDIDTVVLRNYLEMCTEGDEVYYRSTSYSNFSGCYVEIRGSTLKCKFSVNKLYYKQKERRLDNSKPITFRNAVHVIRDLLLQLCIREDETVVTYFEIGVTMKMDHPPDDYIKEVDEAIGRVLWNDANYPAMRQKTTEKSKYYRKVMKIYDKTYEASEKGRKVGTNILRLETIFRFQAMRLDTLIDTGNLSRLGKRFWTDWQEVRFRREIVSAKGVRVSQAGKAAEIYRIGIDRYLERYYALYKEGKLTKKQWETYRRFGKSWKMEKHKYTEIVGDLETEFKEKLLAYLQAGIITP